VKTDTKQQAEPSRCPAGPVFQTRSLLKKISAGTEDLCVRERIHYLLR
jgi:hypothetical protein